MPTRPWRAARGDAERARAAINQLSESVDVAADIGAATAEIAHDVDDALTGRDRCMPARPLR